MTIRIRTHAVVLLAERVHPVPPCGDGVVLPRPVVIGVQAVHLVQFLSVVPSRLHVAVRDVVAELQAGGIVVHLLHNGSLVGAFRLDNLTHAAEVVTVVVVEREAVLAGVEGALHGLAVALLELVLVDAPVPHSKGTPEQVVRGIRSQYLRRCQFPRAAYWDGDVRHRRLSRYLYFVHVHIHYFL